VLFPVEWFVELGMLGVCRVHGIKSVVGS